MFFDWQLQHMNTAEQHAASFSWHGQVSVKLRNSFFLQELALSLLKIFFFPLYNGVKKGWRSLWHIRVEAQGISQGINVWLGLTALCFALAHQLSQLLINP